MNTEHTHKEWMKRHELTNIVEEYQKNQKKIKLPWIKRLFNYLKKLNNYMVNQ